jgi:hypothetical protein
MALLRFIKEKSFHDYKEVKTVSLFNSFVLLLRELRLKTWLSVTIHASFLNYKTQ